MKSWEVVLDTSVLVAGLRSKRGSSFDVLSQLGRNRAIQISVSVPLVLEYEEVLKRQEKVPLSEQEVDDVLDYLCRVANHREIFFLWRPFLRDRGDDLVLEVAVSGGADAILTHEQRGFEGVESTFGIRVLTPGAFLRELEKP